MSGAPLSPGSRLGRYEIIEALGSGAMGQVYLARDVSLNRRVAIKTLGAVHLGRPDLRARFAREARAVAAVSHPNVVQIFDISEQDGLPYFVMEYLKGTDVDGLLRKRGALTVSEAVAIGLSSALGLAEAAANGVVHRDVKPANLFLTDRGVVKVMDFGLAKGFELGANLTGDGITLGTPDYMPPEQGQGLPVDTRADIYALGATLYHLLAGHPPFRGADEHVGYAEVVVRHIKQPAPRLQAELPDIDPVLAGLIDRMLAKDPSQRPTYDDVIAELREVALRINARLPQVSGSSPGATMSGSGRAGAPWTRATTLDRPPKERTAASGLPVWVIGLSVASLVLFLGAAALYLYVHLLPPLPPRPVAEQQAMAGGTGTGRVFRRWRDLKAPAGSILLFVPGTGPIAVAVRPVSPEQVRELEPELTPRLRTLPGGAASGLSLQEARSLTARLGGRLPTSLEWMYIEASRKVRIWPEACEWVDDGPTAKARCYKGTRPVTRNIKLAYKNSLFRVVKLVEGWRPPPER